MACRARMALAVPLLLGSIVVGIAAEPGQPAPPAQIGASEKICQLTGDVDWETGQPTAARTQTNFGLNGVDLGYPVEHDGKLILLFGDTRPDNHPPGASGGVPPDDAVGVTLRREPPGRDGHCLELRINEQPGLAKRYAPATIMGPIAVKQGSFNVPSGGVSVPDGLYGFFWTDHCVEPRHLRPSPNDPLARPPPGDCPENNDLSSIGRGVMARSQDDARTFRNVVPLPAGFVYATAVNTGPLADLPEDQKLGILIFAVPRYRASAPYLARSAPATLGDPTTWQFFNGRGADGHPTWVSHEVWMRGAPSAQRPQAWKAADSADILAPDTPDDLCVGEFSITWNHPLGQWLMLNGCERRILARVAPAPWGPWSEPTTILDVQDVGCRMAMTQQGCPNKRDFWPGRHPDGHFTAGGLYAPFVLDRYTAAANGPGRHSTIYWLVSTWNPYEVAVMRTTLQSGGR